MTNTTMKNPVRRRSSARRGISLLEVLFAMFVLSIGLLSLGALIPVAKILISEGQRAERGSAVGLSGLSDVETQKMLWPQMWFENAAAPGAPGDSACIDPLFLTAPANGPLTPPTSGNNNLSFFPYPLSTDPPVPIPRMKRISLRSYPSAPVGSLTWPTQSPPNYDVLQYFGANRIFTWDDDVTFADLTGDDDRPKASGKGPDDRWGRSGTDDDGVNGTDDPGEAGWASSDDTPIKSFRGDFEWLVTLVPQGAYSAVVQPTYRASVAVFNTRRSTTAGLDPSAPVPLERTVYADQLGDGYGGGQFSLRLPNVGPEYFSIRPNQWIMLAGWMADTSLAQAATQVPPPPVLPPTTFGGYNRPVFKWYRLVSVGEVYAHPSTNEPTRDVTLDGRDWLLDVDTSVPPDGVVDATIDTNGDGNADGGLYDADNNNNTGIPQNPGPVGRTFIGFLFDDLIDVYETNVRPETP